MKLTGGGIAAFECTRKPSGRPLSPGPFYLLCGVTFVKTQCGLSARGEALGADAPASSRNLNNARGLSARSRQKARCFSASVDISHGID